MAPASLIILEILTPAFKSFRPVLFNLAYAKTSYGVCKKKKKQQQQQQQQQLDEH
jgi:hypothetical protein